MSKPNDDPAGVIPLEQAGKLLEIGPERIKQLMREGYIPRDKPGKVSLVGAVRGYIRSLKDAAAKQTKTSADSRVRDARAQEIEMRNAERMRTLIPLEEALAIMDEYTAVVREAMDSIPARVTRDMDVRRKIEAEVNVAHEKIVKAHGSGRENARTGKARPS